MLLMNFKKMNIDTTAAKRLYVISIFRAPEKGGVRAVA